MSTISLSDAMAYVGYHDNLMKFDHYRDDYDPDQGSYSYGDFSPIKESEATADDWIVPHYLSGGDYSNSCLVEESNHRVFLEEFGEVPGIVDLYGGYGSYGVAIRLSTITKNEEIRECLASLEDYPLIDEEDQSQLEIERIEEEWNNWGEHDYVRELEHEYGIDRGIDWDMPDDALRKLFENRQEDCNEYWEQESGGGMHINLEKVARQTTLTDIRERNTLFNVTSFLSAHEGQEESLRNKVKELQSNIIKLLGEKRSLAWKLEKAEKLNSQLASVVSIYQPYAQSGR